ncbi:MAG: SUMF1/EgtB/PvdO family nonheme iron enzyme, partial [Anaerolineae bacterium]
QGYLARKTILFIGYDLADPHFKRLYRKVTTSLDKFAKRAYAFGETPPPKVCRWCERHGIEVIETDATAFLESLTKQLAARARPAPAAPPRPVEEPAAPLPERPYKLLDYYETKDEAIFFGRQQETQTLTSLIHAHRLVLLYGASGVGKTSLLLAGVAPRLESAEPPYEAIYVRALEDPALVIRRTIRRRLPEADLPEDGSLVDFLDVATEALGRTLVIVLDQFEEFFIRLSPQFRAAFIAEFGALYDARDVSVKVVLSLREDWLASVGEIEKRTPEVFRTRMRLLPLTRDQAHQAITAPVERLGVSYEPALVERLLGDLMGSDGKAVMPPQLQLVCNALYERARAEGRRSIAMTDYEALGGVQGVLRKYLDDELSRLGSDERALARGALEELVTSQSTKAVKDGRELALALGVDAAELEPVLEKLVRARLLRPVERAEAKRAYELAHEYLIGEIALSPEAMARKEAEELLRQGVDNWQRFGALLPAETFALIDAQRDRLRLDVEAQELMLRSALRHGASVGYWLVRMEDAEQALALTQEALLAPQGEPARRSLSVAAGDVEPERVRPLVARLATSWRQAQGTERACASDALWALRPHLPRGLRLGLALSRSPRLMRRVALPLVGALVAALLIGLRPRGARIWTPKPEFDWVEIPAGEFLIGSDPAMDPDADTDEMPQHEVYVDAYRISRYEITNAQYAQCVRAEVCREPGELTHYSDPNYADHPAVYVSWFEAREFCNWVKGRLPTEAEWEYAARGPDGHIYPWGNDFDCSRGNFDDETQFDGYVVPGGEGCDGYVRTAPVGSFPAGRSWCGALDTAGNVWEWVADWYGDYPPTAQTNPTGPTTGDYKVLRGGGWTYSQTNARAADRAYFAPGDRAISVGFRCVGQPGE